MPTKTNRKKVVGSDRMVMQGARAISPVPQDERFEVTVRVRRKMSLQSLTANGF
jgi:kumamolisin